MMRRERLGPAVYSALHAHNMLLELMLLPSELRAARADAAALRRRLPFLDDYEHSARDVSRRLRAAYDDYTARVSPASIAIAFRLATKPRAPRRSSISAAASARTCSARARRARASLAPTSGPSTCPRTGWTRPGGSSPRTR
jgi:hypothetical protein